ncbi:MAG: D-aminoacylase [Candidatus Latescibacteria bacterium]|nr:D-aminoacylase [Candidatus Latescibacterota bacterium]
MLDLVIRGAEVIDGTGRSSYTADLGVEGDSIAFVGGEQTESRSVIDAGGLAAAPGFIDIHAHSDYSLLLDGRAMSALHQGVTTQISGNCGISAFPAGPNGPYLGPFDSARLRSALTPSWESAAGYFDVLAERGIAVNAGFLVGHGGVRQAVKGEATDPPSEDEIGRMQELVEIQMREGAMGLSTGLTYVPGSFAQTEEIIALAKVTAPCGGIYATHMRNYNAGIMEALDEAITIGREAGVPVQVSHITPCPPATGSAGVLLERMAEARASGQDVTAETELYATGSTSLKSLLPPWALMGGNDELVARLRRPDQRERMWKEIQEKGSELGGSTKTVLMQREEWDKLWMGNCSVNTELTGKTFGTIGRLRKTDPFSAICDILVEERGAASFYGEDKADGDIDTLAQGDGCGLGTDGLALASDGPLSEEREHPRCYGGMAHAIRTLVRERKALTLEQFVQKVTQFPADRMRLVDRGTLAPGKKADIVVFDPERITDRATMTQPCRYSEGVKWLVVNGETVIEEGRATGARPGRVLRRGIES